MDQLLEFERILGPSLAAQFRDVEQGWLKDEGARAAVIRSATRRLRRAADATKERAAQIEALLTRLEAISGVRAANTTTASSD